MSIVVQGPLVSSTEDLLRSLRDKYPESEIIFSTWDESDFSHYGVFTVYPLDPGPLVYEGEQYFRNLNRQIASTKFGIIRASRDFVAKIRSDFVLRESSDPVSEAFDKWQPGYIVTDTNRRNYPFYPYFISDWFHFGERELILRYWSASHVSNSMATYFHGKEKPFSKFHIITKYPEFSFPPQWSSEQYLCIEYIKNSSNEIKMLHRNDFKFRYLDEAYYFYSQNFKFVARSRLGLFHKKHFTERQIAETFLHKLFSTKMNRSARILLIIFFWQLHLLFHVYLKARKEFLNSLNFMMKRK